MYLSILILPLLGSFVSGFMGRKIGVKGAHFITCTCLILASILATFAFYEVGICGSPVFINLGSWLDSEIFYISWEFLFDQLTISMYIKLLGLNKLYLITTKLVYYNFLFKITSQIKIMDFFIFTTSLFDLVLGGLPFLLRWSHFNSIA